MPRRLKLIDGGGKDIGSNRLGLRPEGKQTQRKDVTHGEGGAAGGQLEAGGG